VSHRPPESHRGLFDALTLAAATLLVALGLGARGATHAAQGGDGCRYDPFHGTCALLNLEIIPADGSTTVTARAIYEHINRNDRAAFCAGIRQFTLPARDVTRLRAALSAQGPIACHGVERMTGSCVPCSDPLRLDAPPPQGRVAVDQQRG